MWQFYYNQNSYETKGVSKRGFKWFILMLNIFQLLKPIVRVNRQRIGFLRLFHSFISRTPNRTCFVKDTFKASLVRQSELYKNRQCVCYTA